MSYMHFTMFFGSNYRIRFECRAYKGLEIMDLTLSDEELEQKFEDIKAEMKEVRDNWLHFWRIFEATGLETVDFEEFDNMDDATLRATYDDDVYVNTKIGSICIDRMKILNGMMYNLSRKLPRFIYYNSTIKKHTWDREQLYEDP